MQAAFAKSLINFTPKKKGTNLLGYAMLDQKATKKESELFVRAVLMVGEKGNYIYSLCMETCFVTGQLKSDIIKHFEKKEIKFKPSAANLMIHAQNTHSAPGGFSSYLLHNVLSGGFNEEFYLALLDACIKTIEKTSANPVQADLIFNVSELDKDKHIAFNRSLDAYNNNKDVVFLNDTQTNLAVNRWMKQLKVISLEGEELGVINWFGVHGNSVDFDKESISSDNKGYAASIFEKEKGENSDFTAIFAQEACGDVSPNYHGSAFRWPRGKYEDSFKSAYHNGFLQYEAAIELFSQSDVDIPIKGLIKAEQAYYNFSDFRVNEQYSESGNLTIGHPTLGLAALKGIAIDSPGIDKLTASFISMWIRFQNFISKIPIISSNKKIQRFRRLQKIHGEKEIIISLEKKKITGFRKVSNVPISNPFSNLLSTLKKYYKSGASNNFEWWPCIVELQYLQIGSLLIVGIPGDITTQAGIRLKNTIMEASNFDFLDVIINSYANEYCGYICTPEEYDKQTYEGGFNVYGRETLGALQTAYAELVKGSRQSAVKNKKPKYYSIEELRKMNLNN